MHSSFTLIRTINIRRGASSSLHSVCPLGNKNNGGLEKAFDQKQELSLSGLNGEKLQVLPSGRKGIRNRRRSSSAGTGGSDWIIGNSFIPSQDISR